jgi:peroxiredoxin Q/BCP
MKKAIVLTCLLIAGLTLARSQVSLGDRVPNFSAVNQKGEKWTLKKELKTDDYLVLYFYPAAFTGGCTQQACAYRDQKGDLEKLNATVVGISGDSPQTLELFALEHGLNFTLLSDESGEIARLFGVPVNEGGTVERIIQGQPRKLTRNATIQRWTFILDNKGNLIYKDSEVDAAGDSSKVVEFLISI